MDSSSASRTRRRRWFGATCLVVAIGMVVADRLALGEHPAPVGFIAYWTVCLLFAVLAIGTALVDLRLVRQHSRHEQRELMEETFREIEREQAARGGREGKPEA